MNIILKTALRTKILRRLHFHPKTTAAVLIGYRSAKLPYFL